MSVPVHDGAPSHTFSYFKIYVDDSPQPLKIQLTPFSGDPDIYVSCVDYPTTDLYQWVSRSIGNETLYISRSEREEQDHVEGWYFIGIYGYSDATFTLVVSLNQNSSIQL